MIAYYSLASRGQRVIKRDVVTLTGGQSATCNTHNDYVGVRGSGARTINLESAATFDGGYSQSLNNGQDGSNGAPPTRTGEGRVRTIKDEAGNASSGTITIDPASSQTIDGQATKTITTDYGSVELISDRANWFTKGGPPAGAAARPGP